MTITPPPTQPPPPVGQTLLGAGLITQSQLESALARQRVEGGPLGRHLILSGAIDRRQMYVALANQWAAPLVDLIAEPPDLELTRRIAHDYLIDAGWVPWKRVGETVVIATSVPPTPELLAEAARRCGVARAAAVTTTDWDVSRSIQDAYRGELLFEATDRLADTDEEASARSGLRRWQVWMPIVVVVLILLLGVLRPVEAVMAVFILANLSFAMNVGFKVIAGVRGPIRSAEQSAVHDAIVVERLARGLPPEWPGRIADVDLPVYTILIPAYRESNIISKVLTNLGDLDYPTSKLDVLVLLEEDDTDTIEATKRMRPPEYVRILIVPPGAPQTKPRACNYGLSFARGKYVVIFDAEDRPQPDQLRAAVRAFLIDEFEREYLGSTKPPLVCVQGALNYFNADYNVLTRMFAVEYAHWFDAMLPGLDDSALPIPLGGTSNHFHRDLLRQMGAWDPYNVTEDADLGLRVAASGYRVGIIDSTTWEEATSQVTAWVKQRTRWIKGYMMTAAVKLRHPLKVARDEGVGSLVTVFGLILGTPLTFLLYPLMLLFTVTTYIGLKVPGLDMPDWLLVVGLTNMLLFTGAMIVASGVAAWRRYNWRIASFALLNPVYWFLHSVASWRAAYQMFFSPHTWEKTPHGLTEEYEDSSVISR